MTYWSIDDNVFVLESLYISIFESEAVSHNWTPKAQIGLRIASHNSSLFSIDGCDLLSSNQYIFPVASTLKSKLFSLGEYTFFPI